MTTDGSKRGNISCILSSHCSRSFPIGRELQVIIGKGSGRIRIGLGVGKGSGRLRKEREKIEHKNGKMKKRI